MAVAVRLLTLSGRELLTLRAEPEWSRRELLVAAGAFVASEYRLLNDSREIADGVTLAHAGVRSGDSLYILLGERLPTLVVAGCLPFLVVEMWAVDLMHRGSTTSLTL